MEIASELRVRLDHFGRLRSHSSDSDITAEQDIDDATALLAVATGLNRMLNELERKAVSSRNLLHVRRQVLDRASRVLVEQIWENPRRRHDSYPVLSNKFAYGGLWSPAAAQMILSGEDYKNKLILEHVVPAKVVVGLLADTAARDGDPLGAAELLSELITHTVLTRADDMTLARDMETESVERLIAHYSGQHPVEDEELFELRWSRYLTAASTGALPFALGDLRPLSQQIAQSTVTTELSSQD